MMETKKKQASDTMSEEDEGSDSKPTEEFWRQPLDDVVKVRKEGTIHVLKSRCKGCAFCIEFCPKQVLVQSEDINEKGYHPPEVKNPDACVFCQLCELICPDIAIYIEVTKSNEDEINNKDKKEDKKD
jgi:2-oxoglutarate ferredoxin oxidoreductase subunit delta